jgi:hypothetical protein
MDCVVSMPETSKPEKFGILWSYDNKGGTGWLSGCVRAIKAQGFVWWDVGWKIKFGQFTFPITGYMWATLERQVKYVTSIESESRTVGQPDKALAKKVEENWIELRLPFGRNDRLHEYLKEDRNELTLLKLSDIRELNPPMGLDDFTLWNGRSLSRPPQGHNRIRLPSTL